MPDTPSPCEKGNSYKSYCVRQLSVDQVFTAVANKLKPEARKPGA
jgi:hypothetical protein